jgi:hypothetical protein
MFGVAAFAREGAEPFPRFGGLRGKLHDATGAPVEGYLIWCDTDTGELERYDYDPKANKFAADPVTKRLLTVRETRPAPLEYRPPTARERETVRLADARERERQELRRRLAKPIAITIPVPDEADAPLIVEAK